MDSVLNFFSESLGGLAWLAVLLVAMLPLAEAKVAIPFGMAVEVWGTNALSPFVAGAMGFIGSMIPCFFIILFLKPLMAHLKKTKLFGKIALLFEGIFTKKAHSNTVRIEKIKAKHNLKNETLQQKNKKPRNRFLEMITLLFFVALPLPLAGVWTSSAIAGFSDMKFWPSVLAIAIGNLFEVIFITLIGVLLIDSIMLMLYITIALVALYVIIAIVVKNKKSKKAQTA